MAERFRFSVVYDPATMQVAGREYLWRYMTTQNTWPSLLLAFALVDALGLALFARTLDFTTGLFAGYGLLLLLIVALMRYGVLRSWRAVIAQAGTRSVEFVLTDDRLEYDWSLVSSKIAYVYFTEIVRLKRIWLVMRENKPLLVLITAQVPADALKFLEDKIKRYAPRALKEIFP